MYTSPTDRCAQCGYERQEHVLVQDVPVCPTAVFSAQTAPPDENHPPTAVLTLVGEAVAMASATFSTAGTADPEGQPLTGTINWHDESPLTSFSGVPSPTYTHHYHVAGPAQATLTVTDSHQQTVSTTTNFDVKDAGNGHHPPGGTLPHGIPDLCADSPDNIGAGQEQTFVGAVSKMNLGVYGKLTLASDCVLTVTNLYVYEGGMLTLLPGSHIVFRDEALNLRADPEQFGNGLLVFGTVKTIPVAKTPFVRLAQGAVAGEDRIVLQTVPVGWHVGDAVVLPESRPRHVAWDAAFLLQDKLERFVDRCQIKSIAGTTVTFTAPLRWDHPGAVDHEGTVVLCPHALNVTRPTVIRSENPSGVRGHVMLLHRASVDLQSVVFKDLGRTTRSDLHCTLFTEGAVQYPGNCTPGTGALTQLGTNNKGRYAVHFHHLMGPVNPTNEGYQAQFVGNAIVDSLKWPLTIHNTSFSLFKDNVIAFGQCAGIMFEDGNEFENVVDGNFITAMDSAGDPREQEARESSGIWLRAAFANRLRNNVVAGLWNTYQQIVGEVGYKYLCAASGAVVRRPNFRGADLTVEGEYTALQAQNLPVLEFDNNEAYGLGTGLTVWNSNTSGYHITGDTRSVIRRLVVWHFWEEGLFAYPVHNWTFDGLVLRGATYSFYDPDRIAPGSLFGFSHGDYKVNGILISDAVMSNVEVGIAAAEGWDGDYTITRCDLHAKVGILSTSFATPGATAAPIADRQLRITDTRYRQVADCPFITILKQRASASYATYPNLPETTTVVNHNGTSDSFNVYYTEQASQNLSGGLAPCTDTRPDIIGLVCPASPQLSGALADYRFGDVHEGVVRNTVDGLPDLRINGNAYSVENGLLVLNIDSTFTYAYPPVVPYSTNGTYLSAAEFPNTFDRGTLGIRLRLNAFTAGVALAPILEFRPVPDVNDVSWGPLMVSLSSGDVAFNQAVWFRWGPHEYAPPGGGYLMSEYAATKPLSFNPSTQEFNIIVTWSPERLFVTVNDSESGEMDPRIHGHNWPTEKFILYVGLSNASIHSGEIQYFGGWLRRLMVYRRALDASEITSLNAALSTGGTPC